MKRTRLLFATGTLALAIAGIFSFKPANKKHPGKQFFCENVSNDPSSCVTTTCTTLNVGQGLCGLTSWIFFTDNTCSTQLTPQPNPNQLFVKRAG